MPKKGPNRTLKKPQVMIPDKHWVKKLKKYMNIPNPTVPKTNTKAGKPKQGVFYHIFLRK